jgi:transposase
LDSAPAESTIEKWFAQLTRGEMCIEGEARSGRPKEAVSDEKIKKVQKLILSDHKVKLIEIAETLKI